MANPILGLLSALQTDFRRPRRRQASNQWWLAACESLETRLLLSAETSVLSPGADPVEQQPAPAFGEPEVCAPPEIAPAAAAATPAELVFPLGDTFHLHSLPGATKRIFLDFDGHTTIGTDWNTFENGGAKIDTPAFSVDATATFTDAELLTIQQIFQRVSEDFIAFNVDVTTEDPGVAALTNSGAGDTEWGIRVAIGGSSSDWYGTPAGGVAYVGSFTANTDTPCFVFSVTDFNNEKYVAEAISHEVGHTLGLNHDGRTTPLEEYYEGQGTGETGWAPIMGAGYYVNVTQWSKGEYANASNLQDDLAIITTQNGFGYRANDLQQTTPLVFNAGVAKANAILEMGGNTTEQFSFNTTGGTVRVDLLPFGIGPGNEGANLDLAFVVVNQANGSIVQTFNTPNTLEVHGQVTLAAGTYLIQVQGVGNANPMVDGYSDYASIGRYQLTVTTNSGPEIDVRGNGLSIDDGDTTPIANENTAFGSQNVVGGSIAKSFTIANTGSAALNLTGTPRVTISGVNASDFIVTAQPAATVAAGGTTTFTITFDPTAGGLRSAIVNIANNDSNENPYNFTISGTGIQNGPEIDVRGNGVSIVDGDTTPSSTDFTAFGSQAVSFGSISRTFTITNSGPGALNLTGTPRVQISGANAADFKVTLQPAASVAGGGGTTTFRIAFDPSAAGLRTATLTIANNDANENPYNFSIAGTGTVQGPEMDVRWAGATIADGDTSPSSTDGTAFGGQSVSVGTVTRTFTIANPGSAALNLTSTPRVKISGLNASDFTVTAQPVASIAAGGTTTFTIVFNPSAGGLRTAIVTIANNDSNENPYNFTIGGTGTVAAAVPLARTESGIGTTSQSTAPLSTDVSTTSKSSSTVDNSIARTTSRRNGSGEVKSTSTNVGLISTLSDPSTSDSNAIDDVFADPSFGELLDPAPATTITRSRRHS